ncbi:MAG: DUF2058 domain-containing protein [Xanthomonadales bacterium]|nr:DUF2058 domain-containing protein [Xanthomonadales bacterium]
MSNSLKDQLLALGLAPKKDVAKGKGNSRKKAAGKKPHDDADISLDQAYRIRNKEEQRQKQKAIAEKRELERRRREVNKKLKGIIDEFAVRDEKAEIKRSFVYKGKIRSVLTTAEQLKQINSGTLGVVYLRGNYHLLPADKVEEIRQFAPDHIPDLGGADSEEEQEHPVPDDLIW